MTGFSEEHVELAGIETLKELGWLYLHGSVIAPDGPAPQRASYSDAVLIKRLEAAVERINPPFVVTGGPENEGRFAVRRRVFFETEGVRAECENDGELGLACKLIAESHNHWQEGDSQNRACIEETLLMEQAAEERPALSPKVPAGHSEQAAAPASE